MPIGSRPYRSYGPPPPLPDPETLPFPGNLVRGCKDCGLGEKCRAPVPGENIDPAVNVMLVGQNPGRNETDKGVPFVGAAGQYLDSLLFQARIPRDSVAITNLVKCLTPGNRQPTPAEIKACSKWLDLEVDTVDPYIIVAMGRPAVTHFLGPDAGSMEQLNGRPIQAGNRIILPMFHPAAALHDTSQLRHCSEAFLVLRELVNGATWRSFHTKDEYPNPDYRVADTPGRRQRMRDEARDSGEFGLDTEQCHGKPWSYQVSAYPGTAWFVPMSRSSPDRVDFSGWPATAIVHFYLHDIQYVRLRDNGFVDNMVLAYLIHAPQGLKELGRRLLGVPMKDYKEIVRPGQQKLSMEYLFSALKQEWPDPPPIEETKWDNRKGEIVTRQKKPWHITRKMNKMLNDMEGNYDLDLWDRWHSIPAEERAIVESVLGVMPESSLADIPRDQAIEYACLSQDSRVRMADGTLRAIRSLVQARSTESVLSWDGQDIVCRPIVDWYRVSQKEPVNWLTVVTRHCKPQLGGINHDGLPGTRYTPDHRILTQRGMIPVCELTPGRDKVALPYKHFSDVQRQVLLGSTLGDGYLANRNSGGWPSLRIGHSQKQIDYLSWKVSLLGDLCHSSIRQYARHKHLPQGGEIDSVVCEAATIAHPEIWDLWREAYRPDKQIYDYVDDLGALGLAILYMDDGTLVNGCTPRISTHAFNTLSLCKLRDVLSRKWGVETRTVATSADRPNQFELFISAPTSRFWRVVAPYVPSCMQRKLPKQWQGHFCGVDDDEVTGLFFSDVLSVVPHPTPASRRGSRKTAWCIDVEGTHNFLTIGEVAHNCRDADVSLRVYHKLSQIIDKLGLNFVQYVDLGILPMVNSMMANGMAVDLDHYRRLSEDYDHRMRLKAAELAATVGHSFNPASSHQVATVIYEELGFKPTKFTTTGLISTDDAELKKTGHPVAEGVIRYRGIQKLKSTYADNMIRSAYPDRDGVPRIHTVLKTTRVETGRLSSAKAEDGTGMNLQNIPTRNKEAKAIKNGFVAPDGRLLIEGDLSQIELRTQAHLAHCKGLIELFLSGRDPHTTTASKLFGIPYEEAGKDKYRYPCKRAGFGVIYMIGAHGLSTQINEYIADLKMEGEPVEIEPWSEERCAEFIEEYYKLYPEIRTYQRTQLAHARRHGYVQDMFGRIRYIPEVSCPIRTIQEAGARMAANFAVTASAQSLLKMAMVELWQGLPDTPWSDAKTLMQIHDSMLFEILDDKGYVQGFVPWVRKVMTGVAHLSVPIEVDFKTGSRWGEMEKYTSEPL